MKILILTPEIHFHSPVVMKILFSSLKGKGADFSVIITPKISSRKTSSAAPGKILENSGSKYLFYMVLMKIKFDLFRFLEKLSSRSPDERKYLSPTEACRLYGVKFHIIRNVNSEECLDIIRTFSPDVILSLFFNQILKKELIGSASKACLNLHPSFLPEYRGMSPVLWMLSEGAEEGGITVHHMDEKVDNGNILSQKRFKIEKDDSFFTVYRKAADTGARMLTGILSSEAIPVGTPQPDGNWKIYGPVTREAFKVLLSKHSFLKFE